MHCWGYCRIKMKPRICMGNYTCAAVCGHSDKANNHERFDARLKPKNIHGNNGQCSHHVQLKSSISKCSPFILIFKIKTKQKNINATNPKSYEAASGFTTVVNRGCCHFEAKLFNYASCFLSAHFLCRLYSFLMRCKTQLKAWQCKDI